MIDAVEEIRTREREVISALLNADKAKLDQMLAPQFIYTASEIGRKNREEWLEAVPTYQLAVLEMVEMDIEPYGDAAVVQAQVRQDAMIHGHHRSGTFLVTDVWACQNGTWRMVSRSSIRSPE